MKVVHLPNSHIYQRYLSDALIRQGVEIEPRSWGWGVYLPDILHDVLALKPDIVHLHWPEALCRQTARGLIRRAIRRSYLRVMNMQEEWGRWIMETVAAAETLQAAGIKIAWTMHNLHPHDANGEARIAYDLLYRGMAWIVEGMIHHSRWGQETTRATYAFRPGCHHALIHFGVFPDEAPANWTREQARREQAIPDGAIVFLAVGSIKGRKNMDLMVKTVGETKDVNCRLLAVGKGTADQIHKLTQLGKGRFHYLGEKNQEELSRIARAADYLLYAPEALQLTTGGPHTSESFLLPQLTTETPYNREVLGDTALYFNPVAEDLRLAIRQAHQMLHTEEYRARIQRLSELRLAHSWELAARKTMDFYTAMLERPPFRAGNLRTEQPTS